MKNYRITVNGTAYDVAVEEIGAGAAPAVAAPAAAPVAAALGLKTRKKNKQSNKLIIRTRDGKNVK